MYIPNYYNDFQREAFLREVAEEAEREARLAGEKGRAYAPADVGYIAVAWSHVAARRKLIQSE